ncbi:MAG: type II toxin-antitoxin system CcdA family antitoxin [Pseudomonadota bacterium]
MNEKPRAPKKAVNLTIDAALAAEAKAAGTNMSAVLERALREELRERRWQQWREENRSAIEASNAEVDRNGMWYVPPWRAE